MQRSVCRALVQKAPKVSNRGRVRFLGTTFSKEFVDARRIEFDPRLLPPKMQDEWLEKNTQLAKEKAQRQFSQAKTNFWGTTTLGLCSAGLACHLMDFSGGMTSCLGFACYSAFFCFVHHDSKLHAENTIYRIQMELDALSQMKIFDHPHDRK